MKPCVFYDGHCSFCLKSVSILRKLDWFKRFDYRDVRSLVATTPSMLEEMHLLTMDGLYHGFKAVRQIAWRLPLLWPVVFFLYIPGIPWLGQRVYSWIARNRSCSNGSCKL